MTTVPNPADMPGCAGGMTMTTHPLELFPIFRRIRPNIPRDLVYTAIWNTLFAIFFAFLSIVIDPRGSFLHELRSTIVFAQCIGFLIHAGFLIGDRIVGRGIHRAKIWVRALYYSAIPVVAIFPGYLLAFRILNLKNGTAWLFDPNVIVSIVVLSLMITGVLLLIFIPRERAARVEAQMAREQARVAAAEKETADARFKLLEAQVEPHFLYNTLAHVVSLVDGEPATAKRMIERLITLLRATASAATGTVTLGGQVELLRAYLDILELRMGPRLKWRIDVPADLAGLRVPPMLLQPLVENAVKHGLEPNVDGGTLIVNARRDGAWLLLEVADTGRGIRATTANGAAGLGLANLRARLVTLYGDHARVTIEDNVPRGTRVSIVLPLASLDTAPTGALAAVQ
jgi:LytS/YehU family sensor histidine kinase